MISALRDVLEVDTAADVGKRVVAVVESISAVKTPLYTIYNRMYLKKQYTWLLIITSANVDRFQKFFHWQIVKETVYVTVTEFSTSQLTVLPHPWEIQKFETTAERLLISSKLISFTWHLTKLNNG